VATASPSHSSALKQGKLRPAVVIGVCGGIAGLLFAVVALWACCCRRSKDFDDQRSQYMLASGVERLPPSYTSGSV
jgi:hypothetical protein